MRSQKCFFPPSSKTKLKKCLWFLGSDGSCEFVFNLRLSQEHTGFSPKIGSTESGWGGKRALEGGKKKKKRRERSREGSLVNEHQMPYLQW